MKCVRFAFGIGCALLLSSCDGGSGETHVFLLSQVEIVFTRGDGPIGVDIDGVSSTSSMDPGGNCGHDDFEDGIDNALLDLGLLDGPLMDFTGDPNEPLAATINSGRLTILVEATDVDSFENDDYVSLRLVRGEGEMQVGPDGPLPGQTFTETPGQTRITGRGRIRDGQLSMSLDGELNLLVNFAQAEGPVRLTNIAATSLQTAKSGERMELSGVLGGVIAIADLPPIIQLIPGTDTEEQREEGRQFASVAARLFGAFGDFDRQPNGICAGMSIALRVRAVEAFLFEDE